MPSPKAIFEAASVLTESKIGNAVTSEVESLASRLWRPTAGEAETHAASTFQKLIEGYKEPIPPTMASANFLHAPENQIASALNAERSGQMAIRLQEASKGWGTSSHVYLTPRIGGKPILPNIELTQETPSIGAVADWANQRARLGTESFPLSISKTGSAVHEMTHHEQAFLAVCRKADEMGLGCKATPEEIEKVVAALKDKKFAPVNTGTTSNFIAFRNGRQLTAAATERADLNIASFEQLFGRPITGQTISSRLNNIEYYQSVLENGRNPNRAKELLQSLASDEQRIKIASQILPSERATAEGSLSLIGSAPKGVKDWSGEQIEKAKNAFSTVLTDEQIHNSRLKRAWDAAYNDSLHEQEARFNQYAATATLRNRAEPITNFWLNTQINLDNLVLP